MKIKRLNESNLDNNVKLICSKIEHHPYKGSLITEIPERVFVIDGYSVADRLLEGIPFCVYFDKSGKVLKVDIEEEAIDCLSMFTSGDARVALNTLEIAVNISNIGKN